MAQDGDEVVHCSECFADQGLRLDAQRLGERREADAQRAAGAVPSKCPHCGATTGQKLALADIELLAFRFFVRGTVLRQEYGAAPVIQFNEHQKTGIVASPWFERESRALREDARCGVLPVRSQHVDGW